MKKLLSTKYSASAFNTALFVLRVGAGLLMIISHGYGKLVNFNQYSEKFVNFLGMGQTTSLVLAIFAEFFCAILLILGLFTRYAALILVINMAVAVGIGHGYDIFGKAEMPTLYLLIFAVIFLVGPGKASIDGMVNK